MIWGLTTDEEWAFFRPFVSEAHGRPPLEHRRMLDAVFWTRASFVPEARTQAMRALLRTRKPLVREQPSYMQRIQNTLEDANLKLTSVLNQIMGFSSRAILDALIVQNGQGRARGRQSRPQLGPHVAPHRMRAYSRDPVDHVIQHAVAQRTNLRPILRVQVHAIRLARLSAKFRLSKLAIVSPASTLINLTTASVMRPVVESG